MKQRPIRSRLSMALIGGMSAAMLWSGDSHACPAEPYISAVCIMAIPWTNLSGYMPANGATLSPSSYQALFSLIGITYGGDGNSTFMLPDLRGRVVVGTGAGPGLPVYNIANKGGAVAVVLTDANVPLTPHTHTVGSGVTVTAGLGSLAANTTLSGLTATTSLSGVTASASSSGLALKGYSGAAGTSSANGAALATPASPTNKIYASSTPDVTMMAGSITGSAAVSFTGNPTTTITGTPSTTLSGAPAVTISGSTGPAGSSATEAVGIMPPYLAMNYFIAIEGIYPPRD